MIVLFSLNKRQGMQIEIPNNMDKKFKKTFSIFAVLLIGFGLVGYSMLVKPNKQAIKNDVLRMRQPEKVVAVNYPSTQQGLRSNIEVAKNLAEQLDEESKQLLNAGAMGFFERLFKKKNLSVMRIQYSKMMMLHLKAMTAIFKSHRQFRGFQKLQELEFRNLINKSDYLVSLYVSKESLLFAGDQGLGAEIQITMKLYNKERMHFDRKMLSIAMN